MDFSRKISAADEILARFSNIFGGSSNKVLMYHSVGGGLWDNIPPELFRRHLRLLTKKYKIVDIPEITNHKSGKKRIAITFDDGYYDFYTHALPILREFEVPATLFIIGRTLVDPDFVQDDVVSHKYLSTEQIFEILDEELITIGNHTLTHPDLSGINNKRDLKSEIIGGKELIENELGISVDRFAYPYNAFNRKSAKVVQKSHSFGVCGGGIEHLISAYTNPSLIPRVNGAQRTAVLKWKISDICTYYNTIR